MAWNRDPEVWRLRARENGRAASLLAGDLCLPHAAVSRLYHACFQATVARLLELGRLPASLDLAEIWRAADAVQGGLGGDLQDLYGWRRKAEQAAGRIETATARALVRAHRGTLQALGVADADG